MDRNNFFGSSGTKLIVQFKRKRWQAERLLLQRLYFYYRWVGDQLSDAILNQALAERMHVIWETTGNSIEWTFKELSRVRRMGYRTLIVYPYVKFDLLLSRLEARKQQTGQDYASPSQIEEQVNLAKKNFEKLKRSRRVDGYMKIDNGQSHFTRAVVMQHKEKRQ